MESASFLQIPESLVNAILLARKTEDLSEFEEELGKHNSHQYTPEWWVKVLRGLAQQKNLMEIVKELNLIPWGFCRLNIIQTLEKCDFPKWFLQEFKNW